MLGPVQPLCDSGGVAKQPAVFSRLILVHISHVSSPWTRVYWRIPSDSSREMGLTRLGGIESGIDGGEEAYGREIVVIIEVRHGTELHIVEESHPAIPSTPPSLVVFSNLIIFSSTVLLLPSRAMPTLPAHLPAQASPPQPARAEIPFSLAPG
ncbi:hypothetical protein NLJ89_g7870 [Agrocybe chaxingu]|uniref:Uncharacterized protein n=1 Tax=Agrocybe chaxingu TaxID=84603 RepID=A0A9W8K2T6_9AGAR|nr:hypothetical protein NLJ89_g7870 [Agrocybe chaxingu]